MQIDAVAIIIDDADRLTKIRTNLFQISQVTVPVVRRIEHGIEIIWAFDSLGLQL